MSYDQNELLEIRAAITHPVLEEFLFFNELDGKDLLQTPDKALIPVIHRRKIHRYHERRSMCLVRICHREGNLPLPSVLLVKARSNDNKIDKLRARISYQRDIKNCNICFTESWVNDVAVYLPPQIDAGTKTALNELYKQTGKLSSREDTPSGRGL